MELRSSKFLMSPTHYKYPTGANPAKFLGISFRKSPLVIRSKKSSYQDFQEYAKPSRLFPAGGVRLWRDASSLKNAFASLSSSESKSLYKVRLQTSSIYGSGLSDVNSGILLCLIGENGSSILQRLPAMSEECDALHFQIGSIDEFAFEGPLLGRILAVWISLESGQWRIGGINLRSISQLGEKNRETTWLTGLQYDFELEDILLGEKGDAPMMELRPSSVTAFSKEAESTPSSMPSLVSNEESMREYAYLKASLLLYDSVLTLAGSAVASSMGENAAYAFLIGGMLGFGYLLVLQGSVDELPAPESEKEVSGSGIIGKFVPVVVLVSAVMATGLKYGVKLEPKDLLLGTMGFLMCKVSVVLAAFRPMSPGLIRENE